ncbi:MAG: precorrin-3B C(17)-methyltransferase [Cyanobacteria bacterium P01_D01_bin.105]
MPTIAAITTTPLGLRCLAPLCEEFAQLWITPKLKVEAEKLGLESVVYQTSLSDLLREQWQNHDGFVFCLASGAVVRLIAPLLTHKADDPAVVVVDQSGKFAISLCGGHQSGGDRLTTQISQLLNAQPVLTGASNALNLPAIDTLGEPFGWGKGSGDWLGVSSAIARLAPVQVIQDAGTTLWQKHLPSGHSFQFGFPDFAERNKQPHPQARVWISPIKRSFAPHSEFPKVQWHPRVLWVGVGCERGTDRDLIEWAISSTCEKHHLAIESIAGIGTLDLKADEVGLLALTQDKHWPLRCFTADLLQTIDVPNPSDIVAKEVGTPSVCEAAALTAARASELQVKKQVIKKEGMKGAVTVAIAQVSDTPLAEYTGRAGKLHLVGTGPGSLNQITPAAKTAIANADVVIGYELYVDLIRSLLRPGQVIEGLPITQERQRAEQAIELANWGLTVTVISSGDCGIYGMAGLVLEQLRANGWDGRTPEVQVFPGVSALQSAASRVGAPLMHDFCAISLSNLLTPWAVIQKRIKAAAEGDFIVALYNPKSKTRTAQIEFAQETFLQYRDQDTPVALAKSLYRPAENITLTTLGDMLTHDIDMLTTVIVGNRSSRSYKGWFITPRGYLSDLDSNPNELAQP